MGESMISWEEARTVISRMRPIRRLTEVPLADAAGKISGQDLFGSCDSPPFDNSAVDGYAVFPGFDKLGSLELGEPLYAGSPIPSGQGWSGDAVRVLTGSPVPPGTDRVVMQEDCSLEGSRLVIRERGKSGQHIRRRAEDFKIGDTLVRHGEPLTPARIGLLASGGITHVKVWTAPRVGLLVTGDELAEPGQELQSGQIYNSNWPALLAALHEMGVANVRPIHTEDTFAMTVEAFNTLDKECDLLLAVGGLADGDRDHVRPALRELGARPVFSGVAVKPGKPVSLFLLRDKPVFCLPGNPVSALTTMFFFVRPFIASCLGVDKCEEWERNILSNAIEKKRGRAEFVPGSIVDGRFEPTSSRGSHLSAMLASGSRFALFPTEKSQIEIGCSIQTVSADWRFPRE